MRIRFIIFGLSILLICNITAVLPKAYAATATLSLEPSSIVDELLIPPKNITLSLKIAEVSDLFAYEIKVYYSNSILNCAKVIRPAGHFLEPQIDPNSFFVAKWEIKNDFNATHGRIWISYTMFSPEQGKAGNGTLAQITFRIQGAGSTPIDLTDTKLVTPLAEEIPHTQVDGSFSNTAEPPPPPPIMPAIVYVYPKDITNASLAPSTFFAANIDIINATKLHTFEFKLDYDGTLIEVEEIAEGSFLNNSGSTIMVNETDNTSGFVRLNITLIDALEATGNGRLATFTFKVLDHGSTFLTLSDVALLDTADQNITYITENGHFDNAESAVAVKGDVNGDGTVDLNDLIVAGNSLGAKSGDTIWNPKADLNFDGMIDVYDLVIILKNFGRTEPVISEFAIVSTPLVFMLSIGTTLTVQKIKKKRDN